MKNLGKLIWGVMFIIVGVVVAINSLGILDINIFFKGWWTLFIIVPCFIGLFQNESKTSDIIGLIIGVALLLASRGIFDFSIIFKLIVPLILVGIGISLLFNETIKKEVSQKISNAKKSETESIVATFAEQKVNKDNEEFKGAVLDCVFGNIVLDLRKSKITKEATIKASTIFGGMSILLPEDVKVVLKSTPIFGGVSNKITNKDSKKTIYIDALCVFGGIDIK